jgi:RNA polymerase-binding transcription factor DksA
VTYFEAPPAAADEYEFDAPADGGSGVDLGLLDELTSGLGDVQAALERLDSGTYGTCEVCGSEILDSVLEERPTTRTCEEHSAASAF